MADAFNNVFKMGIRTDAGSWLFVTAVPVAAVTYRDGSGGRDR